MTGATAPGVGNSPMPSTDPSNALTNVELTWVEGRIEYWIRFGRGAGAPVAAGLRQEPPPGAARDRRPAFAARPGDRGRRGRQDRHAGQRARGLAVAVCVQAGRRCPGDGPRDQPSAEIH